MNGIIKIIKRGLLLILGIAVLFLLNIAWHRMRGPTQEERTALALVEAPTSRPQGRNAFALVRLFSKDVPDADIERLAAQDVQYARSNKSASREVLQFPSETLPELAQPQSGSEALCAPTSFDCLASVRNSSEATRALLANHDRLLQRAVELEEYEFLYDEFPRAVSMPFLNNVMSQRLRTSQLALMFEDGMRTQAVAGVCRNLSMWRRFGADNRSLTQTLLAVAQRDTSIQLLADMLAELEPEVPLPVECSAALAAVAAKEVSLCSSMLGQFDVSEELFKAMTSADLSGQKKGWLEAGAQPLLLDTSRTRAWNAADKARYCQSGNTEQALQDQPINVAPLEIDWFDCQANRIGCILTQIAAPAFTEYEKRLLDSAAHLRLAATLAWLRETSSSNPSLQQRFEARPEPMRSGSRASGISDDGNSVWVDNFNTKQAARYSLPIRVVREYTP